MAKYRISKVKVKWSAGKTETFENVEINMAYKPQSDKRTFDLLKSQFPGCERIIGVYTPIEKIS